MEALKVVNRGELEALIRLVDDPDPEIFHQIKRELIDMGPAIVPALESKEFSIDDDDHHGRLQDIIREIRFKHVQLELGKWRDSSNRDLLKGALIISKFQYPEVEETKVVEELERIKQMVWLEINEDNTAFEIVKIFNRVLFDIYGFKSSRTNFYSPQNSFINTVLESKVGNPLSLSVIYSVIAQKLQIPIYGVNLPNHFVLGFIDEFQTLKMLGLEDDRNILFYINPFSKGRIFDHNEIENYLRSLNLPLEKDYFEPCSNTDILKRMLTNLSYAYSKEGDYQRVEDLKVLHNLLEL